MLQLISGKRPYFQDRAHMAIENKIAAGTIPKRKDYDPSDMLFVNGLWELLERCWVRPKDRADILEVVALMEVIVIQQATL